VIRVSVVKATADVGRPAVLERTTPRQDRAASREPARLDQLDRVRNFHPQFLGVSQHSSFQFADVFLRMDEQYVFVRRRIGREEIGVVGNALGEKRVVHEAIFL